MQKDDGQSMKDKPGNRSDMRVGMVTLGCDKNTVDNEYLAGLLSQGGLEIEIADPASPPDVVVILAGDHGTDSRNQLAIHPEVWTDDMIRERLNAMFAIRGPAECRPPEPVLLANLFASLLECLSEETLPALPEQMYIYGAAEFDGLPSPIIAVEASTVSELLGTSASD